MARWATPERTILTPSANTNKGQRLLEIGAPKGAHYSAKRIVDPVRADGTQNKSSKFSFKPRR
jgi:hypothetical protein